MKQSDIVIVGGGIVGTVLAKGLSQLTGFSVALIDAQDSAQSDGINPREDKRVIALAKRTVNELTAMGVPLHNLAQQNPGKIEHIEVSDKGWLGMTELHCNDYHLDAFGQVVSLSALAALVEQHTHSDGITHIAPASVSAIERTAIGAKVTLNSGECWHAKLVIMADGGQSPLIEQVGIHRTQTPYDQVAVVANVHTQLPHNNKAYERFTPNGPLAFLPFDSSINGVTAKGNGFSVVWTVSPDKAKALLSLSDKPFLAQLQNDFGFRQGAITLVSDRVSYPLSLRVTDNVYSHRTVVVGNAAQTLHPIAGQGFNLALRDIVTLVSHLTQCDDPGDYATLRQYGQSRQQDRDNTIALTDTLVRTFSNSHFPLVLARNAALLALNMVPSLKRRFVKQTTGFAPSVKPKHAS